MVKSGLLAPPNPFEPLYKAIAMFKRDARLALSYDLNFWLQWISIGVSVLGFYYISKLMPPKDAFGTPGHPGRYFDWIVINLAFVRFQATAIASFQMAIRNDQMAGTLEVLMATPTSLPLIVLSTGLWGFTLTAIQVCVFMLLAVPLGADFSHVNLLTGAVFVLLTIACMSPIGVMSAATIMTFKQAGPAGFIMGSGSNLLGGVLFPVATLPVALQYVSWFLPITHALNGIRGAVHGLTLGQVAPDALWLAVATCVLLPISLYSFGRAVQRAKLDGTLGQY
ncbi:MAG: ABC transporter permease [Candidatus Eremiobacteraeota bacterium]|nr:ABC transporter permease [Candidatus Eremiobacteraeota bacterium]MBC5827286.1 ABC transporter permease [Candidatus Eremiobacteraeota bacterium]